MVALAEGLGMHDDSDTGECELRKDAGGWVVVVAGGIGYGMTPEASGTGGYIEGALWSSILVKDDGLRRYRG